MAIQIFRLFLFAVLYPFVKQCAMGNSLSGHRKVIAFAPIVLRIINSIVHFLFVSMFMFSGLQECFLILLGGSKVAIRD